MQQSSEERIERIGNGVEHNPYRYFLAQWKGTSKVTARDMLRAIFALGRNLMTPPRVPPSEPWLAKIKGLGIGPNHPRVLRGLEILRKKETTGELTIQEQKDFHVLDSELVAAHEFLHGKIIHPTGEVAYYPELRTSEQIAASIESLWAAKQEKDSRPFAANLQWMLENHPDSIPGCIDFLKARSHKFREAVFFAEEHIKAGKPWDQECEKVIGEVLRPKRPEGRWP